jgi:hypothetical protein
MNVELLRQPPVSGSIPERWFDAAGPCTWVRFEPSIASAWAGVFGAGGVVRSSAVVPFADGRHVLVIAQGRGYVVDGETGVLRYRTASEFLVQGLTIPQRDFVIACSWTHLFAFGTAQELWSGDVALDGIRLGSATTSELRGEAWSGSDWRPFTLAFDGWLIHPTAVTRA